MLTPILHIHVSLLRTFLAKNRLKIYIKVR
nr:MAG TPA: hypothetical protein [Bacteriophage sp.]